MPAIGRPQKRRNISGIHPGTALAGAALLLCGLSACGSGGDGGTAPPAASSAPTATLPPGTKAVGEPVRVGYIADEGGSTVSQPDVRAGAEAAVRYANDHLGGIAGRPIDLVVCKEQEDPASARACANTMVEDKVAAVVVGITAQGDAMAPSITAAGIPYVSVSGASAAELTGSPAFMWSGGFPATLAAMADYARQNKISSVALALTAVGALPATVQAIGQPRPRPGQARDRLLILRSIPIRILLGNGADPWFPGVLRGKEDLDAAGRSRRPRRNRTSPRRLGLRLAGPRTRQRHHHRRGRRLLAATPSHLGFSVPPLLPPHLLDGDHG
ncbi:ABC transporter substrate-binding protein [Frankia sp. AiPs1]|uniref:ABC transporter substrate-binding protein n=1 Tax=Frankia sp. AiPs1 TaxID=573493 RepID=UPI002043DDC1|nr:ABC transporter substrate-binding protein [Frankia sp. AiPs1]MCM3924757.1 ABC transporter substrate-binding protein [Frankia sp. AiPs1]